MKTYLVGLLAIILFFSSSCGKKSDSTSSTSTSSSSVSTYPLGFAVGSILSSTTSASAMTIPTNYTSFAFNSEASPSAKAATLDAVAAGTKTADCTINLPNLTAPNSPSCYGPTVDYQNHIDGTSPSSGQLPSGDLGIWTATNGSNSEACAAAKLTSLINSATAYIDSALLYSASIACLMRVNGVSTPAIGASVDMKTLLASATSTNSGLSITSASFERLANSTAGNAIYKDSIVATIGSNSTTLYLKHEPLDSSNSTYKGVVYGTISNSNPNPTAFSVVYSKDSSASLKIEMTYATMNGSNTPHNSDGTLKLTSAGSNINRGVFNLNPSNWTGNVSYSWQAGSGDSHTRVFNIHTETSGSTTTGCGFFGFGSNFNTTTGTAPNNSITTMICNWAGPGNSHTGQTGKAQKQCMTKNSSGVFVYDSTKNKIAYSPNNSCSMTSGQNGASGSPFGYKLSSETSYPSTQPAVTNDLVTLSSDTDFASYTAPTAPTPPQ